MAEKKISFGFSKIKKPTLLVGTSGAKKDNIELIQCLEENSIKIIGEEIKKVDELVIPLRNNTKTSAALAALQTLKDTLEGREDNDEDDTNQEHKPETQPETKTIEQRAALEILNSLKESNDQDSNLNNKLSLPLKPDELPLNGASESSIDDYERIPIAQYGLAMLRGMGWKEPTSDKKKKLDKLDGPVMRPKGMGLGADKMIKAIPLLIPPEKNEVLEIKKSASVRILLGKHKDMYGQIESLDDHAGRLLIKLALGGTKEWFSEFMVQPVSKQEYTQYAKVINSAKYEEYKRKQIDQELVKKESIKSDESDQPSSSRKQIERQLRRSHSRDSITSINSDHEKEKYRSNSQQSKNQSEEYNDDYKNRSDRYDKRSPTNSRYRSHNRKDYSSDESDHTSKKRSSHKKKTHSKHHKSRSRSPSNRHRNHYHSSSEDEKYHKKKTKKSKRPRSRSRSRNRR